MKSPGTDTVRLLIVSLMLAFSAGCHSPLFRGQSPDAEQTVETDDGAPLIGDLTLPSGLNYVRVEGVGLVTHLSKTGSDPPPSPERDTLIADMQSYDVLKPQSILASGSTSMVKVVGYLPPGVQKGDRFDLQVGVPPRSETTSLRGGWLMQTRLREMAIINNTVHSGNVDAIGGGDVVIDAMFDDEDTKKALVEGRVLGGGVSMTARKLGLVLRENAASVRGSAMIGSAINARFFHFDRGTKTGVANPVNSGYVELAIPPRYKNNVTRYMKVVRSITVGESLTDRQARMQQLETKLFEPTTSYSAALQLEAIGKESIPVLRKGLQSNDAEIRFYVAEALAYLEDMESVPALADAARQERAFRWHALTALSAIDHIAANEALTELLNDRSAEVRYGAFRAMQARNPNDPYLRGEILGEAFAFHEVNSSAEPIIHFSHSRRPEVVLFGYEQTMRPPICILAGRSIMLRRQDDQQIKVIRFAAGADDQVIVCQNRVADVIRAIVELGGTYENVFQAMRRAKALNLVDSRIVVDARASRLRQYQRDDEESENGTDETSPYKMPGPVPELFQDRLDRPISKESGLDTETSDDTPDAEDGFFDKIKNWWTPDKQA